ncbi:hypothetical protein ABIB45_004609 [Arthrobacter sp. UYCo732]
MSFASSRAPCLSVRCSAPICRGPADPVERIYLTAPVPEGVLLDPAADLIDHCGSEYDDVERV